MRISQVREKLKTQLVVFYGNFAFYQEPLIEGDDWYIMKYDLNKNMRVGWIGDAWVKNVKWENNNKIEFTRSIKDIEKLFPKVADAIKDEQKRRSNEKAELIGVDLAKGDSETKTLVVQTKDGKEFDSRNIDDFVTKAEFNELRETLDSVIRTQTVATQTGIIVLKRFDAIDDCIEKLESILLGLSEVYTCSKCGKKKVDRDGWSKNPLTGLKTCLDCKKLEDAPETEYDSFKQLIDENGGTYYDKETNCVYEMWETILFKQAITSPGVFLRYNTYSLSWESGDITDFAYKYAKRLYRRERICQGFEKAEQQPELTEEEEEEEIRSTDFHAKNDYDPEPEVTSKKISITTECEKTETGQSPDPEPKVIIKTISENEWMISYKQDSINMKIVDGEMEINTNPYRLCPFVNSFHSHLKPEADRIFKEQQEVGNSRCETCGKKMITGTYTPKELNTNTHFCLDCRAKDKERKVLVERLEKYKPQITSKKISEDKWRVERTESQVILIKNNVNLDCWNTTTPLSERNIEDINNWHQTYGCPQSVIDEYVKSDKERKVLVERLEKYEKCDDLAEKAGFKACCFAYVSTDYKEGCTEFEKYSFDKFFAHLVELLYDTRNQDKARGYFTDDEIDVNDYLLCNIEPYRPYKAGIEKEIRTIAKHSGIPKLEVICDLILTIKQEK